MNLQSLRALCTVVDRGLHLSNAAQALHRSQPALTRQIQQLEAELGITLFVRQRNRILSLTREGEAIVAIARRMLNDARDLTRVAAELANAGHGELTVATTHTQARYTLPPIIRRFMEAHPGVALALRQGTPAQCDEMVAQGTADIAICTETSATRDDVVHVPCYRLNRIVVTPPRHPLLREKPLTLQAIARYPVITYAEGFSGRTIVDRAFADAGLAPKVVLSAIDADVSKSYVALGLGIAILAGIAFDPRREKELRAVDARHLFPPSRLVIVLRRNAHVPAFLGAFVRLFAPHVKPAELRDALRQPASGAAARRILPDL